MGKKLKNFRIDETIAEEFEEWCHQLGVVQERVIEAMMHQASAMSPDACVKITRSMSEWKTSNKDPSGSSQPGRSSSRSAPH